MDRVRFAKQETHRFRVTGAQIWNQSGEEGSSRLSEKRDPPSPRDYLKCTTRVSFLPLLFSHFLQSTINTRIWDHVQKDVIHSSNIRFIVYRDTRSNVRGSNFLTSSSLSRDDNRIHLVRSYLLRWRALDTVSPRWRHIDLETNDREYCTVASSHRVRNIKLLAETDPKRIFSRDDYCRFEKEEIYPGARNTRIDTRLHGTRTCPGNKTHTRAHTHT